MCNVCLFLFDVSTAVSEERVPSSSSDDFPPPSLSKHTRAHTHSLSLSHLHGPLVSRVRARRHAGPLGEARGRVGGGCLALDEREVRAGAGFAGDLRVGVLGREGGRKGETREGALG